MNNSELITLDHHHQNAISMFISVSAGLNQNGIPEAGQVKVGARKGRCTSLGYGLLEDLMYIITNDVLWHP